MEQVIAKSSSFLEKFVQLLGHLPPAGYDYGSLHSFYRFEVVLILCFHWLLVFNWFFGPFLVFITLFWSNIKSEDTFFSSHDSTLLESRGPKKMCSLISYGYSIKLDFLAYLVTGVLIVQRWRNCFFCTKLYNSDWVKMFKIFKFLLYCSSREVVSVLHKVFLPLNHVKYVIKYLRCTCTCFVACPISQPCATTRIFLGRWL